MIKNDDNLRSILLEKETPTLNPDFEDKMMLKIHQHVSVKERNKENVLLIYLFFALGLVLGFVGSFSLENITIPFRGIMININRLVLFIPLIIGLLFLFEKVYKTILFQKGKEEIFEI